VKVVEIDGVDSQLLQGFGGLRLDVLCFSMNTCGGESELGGKEDIISLSRALEPILDFGHCPQG